MKGVCTHPLIVAVAMGLLSHEALDALPSDETDDEVRAWAQGLAFELEAVEAPTAKFAAVEVAWREARSRV